MKQLSIRLLFALFGAAFLLPFSWAADVEVKGTGNVGIGQMSGGTVNLGLTPQETKALAVATGQELIKQLTYIVQRMNVRAAAVAGEDKISLGVAEAFLATLKGKKVPQSEWSTVFGELTREYLQLGARIKATPVTSNRIKGLVNQADAARALGRFDDTDKLLAEAAEIATEDAKKIQQQARESIRQAASLNVSRAWLALTRLDRKLAATLFEKAANLRNADLSPEAVWWLLQAGEALWIDGQSAASERLYGNAERSALLGLEQDPDETRWQLVLARAHDGLGVLLLAKDQPAVALKNFEMSFSIRARIVDLIQKSK